MMYVIRTSSRWRLCAFSLTCVLLFGGFAAPEAFGASEQAETKEDKTIGERAETFRQKKTRIKHDWEQRVPYVDDGEWQAFFRDADGYDWAVEEPMEQYDDELWLELRFSEFYGNRSRLAVMWLEKEIEPKPGKTIVFNEKPFYLSEPRPLQTITGFLTTALYNTNRFDLLDRADMDAILKEQEIGKLFTTETSAAKVGKALGVDYVMLVEVNEYTDYRQGRGANWLGLGQKEVEIAISFKVLDTETTRVVFANTARGRAADQAAGVPVFGFKSKSPMNYAVTSAINKMAYRLAMSLPIEPWQGSVVDVHGDIIAVNGGLDQGLEPGMKLLLLDRGKEILDTESGDLLGYREEVIGSAQITAVRPRMSTAVLIDGGKGLNVADFVRLEVDGNQADAMEAQTETAAETGEAVAP